MFTLFILLSLLILSISGLFLYMMQMPGVSFQGHSPPLTAMEIALANRLQTHVTVLAKEIQGRNHHVNDNLTPARDYITEQLQSYGYVTIPQTYQIAQEQFNTTPARFTLQKTAKTSYTNVVANLLGTDKAHEIIIVGAHYDSVPGSPGANDNGSGVAAVLELARLLATEKPLARTVRFVAFANEEPPFFQTEAMGSLVYAKQLAAQQENVVAMLSLETIGYYSDVAGSQKYPPPFRYFYPDRGNFIGFVSNLASRKLLREAIATFRQHATLPSEAVAAPAFIPGIGWSDQWAFWQQDYPAIMITDTALFRYPYYHTAHDTPDKLNYVNMAYVIIGLRQVIIELATR